MAFNLDEKILKFLEENQEQTLLLTEQISKIPAPSGKEERRAEFVKNWLEGAGAKGVCIDGALNVVYKIDGKDSDDIIAFIAHTDTVFPDTEYPMPFSRDDKYLYSPGVGDDTVCLAIMLMVVKYIVENNLKPSLSILFAANSCEEGLGNLKGVKQLMKDYGDKVKTLYTFDGTYRHLVNKCVGSHRYKITFETEGGHSFNNFGNRNAIYAMSQLINSLYACKVPVNGDSVTTYNVGIVDGGTSVNTIAQNASMLYEYRSDDKECLSYMQNFFNCQIEEFKKKNLATINVELIGDRPCGGDVDKDELKKISDKVVGICEKHTGIPCKCESGSTDANIPMSLGIPAVCVGVYMGSGAHTREETVEIASVPKGLKIAAELILEYFD